AGDRAGGDPGRHPARGLLPRLAGVAGPPGAARRARDPRLTTAAGRRRTGPLLPIGPSGLEVAPAVHGGRPTLVTGQAMAPGSRLFDPPPQAFDGVEARREFRPGVVGGWLLEVATGQVVSGDHREIGG